VVPANLRHFQPRRRKSFHRAGKKTESFFARRLLARLEQKLIPHANAEKRLVRAKPVLERIPERSRLDIAHAIAEIADARQHHGLRIRKLRRIAHEPHVRALASERLAHAANISTAVIDQRDHASRSLTARRKPVNLHHSVAATPTLPAKISSS